MEISRVSDKHAPNFEILSLLLASDCMLEMKHENSDVSMLSSRLTVPKYIFLSIYNSQQSVKFREDFDKLDLALDEIGVTKKDRQLVYRRSGSILALGSINFVQDSTNSDYADIENRDKLLIAATLLDVDEQNLRCTLTQRPIRQERYLFVHI